MNVYRAIDRERIQFDFLLRNNQNNAYEEEVTRLGGRVYYLPPFPSKAIANYKALSAFMRERAGEYGAIHIHANSLVYIAPLILAKRNGIARRILHSHSSKSNYLLSRMAHRLFRLWIPNMATNRIACSPEAGAWMFADRDYELFFNAVDTNRFRFHLEQRQAIRSALGIMDAPTIGHIGRFVKEKNHIFMLDIISHMREVEKNIKLLLVGEGPLEQSIRDKVQEMRLSENVVFLGVREDISALLSAFDMFLLPSLFEGLPFVLVEAQFSALPCLISDTISPVSVFFDDVETMSLTKTAGEWANVAFSILQRKADRKKKIDNPAFDIQELVTAIERIYIE